MKKIAIIILVGVTLSACSERNSPDELRVVKYKKLQMPKNISKLPVPNSNTQALGYKTAQQSVDSTINLKNDENIDNDIISVFNIKTVSNSIRDSINALKDITIIVDTKKEEQRIADNKKAGRKVTVGRTPTNNLGGNKTGLSELFK